MQEVISFPADTIHYTVDKRLLGRKFPSSML